MKILLTFKGKINNDIKKLVADDSTSPSGGYTPFILEDIGKSYVESGRVQELFGNDDQWEFLKAKKYDPRDPHFVIDNSPGK